MNVCSVCKKEFEDNYFDIDQQKCILHCDKNPETTVNNIDFFNDCLDSYFNDQPRYREERRILKNVYFPDDFTYESVLNQYSNILFIACTFQSEIYLAPALSLRFYRCTFKNAWKHIICKKIEYSRCDFDNFIYSNIAKVKDVSKDSVLFDCTFKSIDCEGVIFEKPFIQIVDERKAKHIDDIKLTRCEFVDDFILNVTDNSEEANLVLIKLQSINLSHSIFHKKFKMQYCNVKNDANFYNTKFKDLADFYRTEFNKVIFERTDFEAVVVFSEVKFNQNVNFKYTKFLGYSVFRDTVIKGKLDLRNTIFYTNSDANFLDITSEERKRDPQTQEFYGEPKVIQVANRETAKIIKSFYEYSNNIIESNKFYALEMKEREKELDKSFKDRKNLIEWAIFKLHGLSSNHSQDPVSPILWILNIAFIYSLWISRLHLDNILGYFAVLIAFIGILSKNKFFYKAILFGNLILPASASFITLAIIADKINPFSIMTSKDPITFGLLLFKITIAYLIYQFIVSVRQNTRRK